MSTKCSYQQIILFTLLFHLFLIVVWLLTIHYVDIFGPISDPSHLTISNTNSKPSHSEGNELHTIYSVGCDNLMYWMLQQSVTLDYSWHVVKQPGHLTRIVSGCNYAAKHIREMSRTSIPMKPDIHFLDDSDLVDQCLNQSDSTSQSSIFPLNWNVNSRFHILFMPSYDDIKERHKHLFNDSVINRYPQLNRIVALYILYHCTDYTQIPMEYAMVLDPDFIFLKALRIDELQRRFALSLHHPVAGNYGLGNRWVQWLKEKDDSIKMEEIQSAQHYESGVPVTNSMYFSIFNLLSICCILVISPCFNQSNL